MEEILTSYGKEKPNNKGNHYYLRKSETRRSLKIQLKFRADAGGRMLLLERERKARRNLTPPLGINKLWDEETASLRDLSGRRKVGLETELHWGGSGKGQAWQCPVH